MLLGAPVLGYLAFRRYLATDRYLEDVRRDLAQRGRSLTVPGCIDAVISWRGTCPTARVLCDSFAARAMGECLGAQDRRAACSALPRNLITTHYAFKECQRHCSGCHR